MDAVRESIHRGLLSSSIVNADFGVGHTTVEAGLGVRLPLNLPVAPSRTCTDENKQNQTRVLKSIENKKPSQPPHCGLAREVAHLRLPILPVFFDEAKRIVVVLGVRS